MARVIGQLSLEASPDRNPKLRWRDQGIRRLTQTIAPRIVVRDRVARRDHEVVPDRRVGHRVVFKTAVELPLGGERRQLERHSASMFARSRTTRSQL